MNESDIIKGCLRNDRASQKMLYEEFYSKLLGVCLRYSSSGEEAKKILHAGFIKVFDNLKNFKIPDSFENWIKKTMIHTAIDYLRKNKQNYWIVSTVYANENARAITDKMNDNDLAARVDSADILRAVQELTPAYRTVFNLYVIENYSHKEIAEILDISEETSKSNLSKATFNLRKNITQRLKTNTTT